MTSGELSGAMRLRERLERREFFVAPGIQDMITAAVAGDCEVKFAYASGYWMTASALGLPDAGIATYTEMVDRVRTLARCLPGAAIIADADTGYGGLLNVHHTVRGFEEAGAAAVQIEDQEFPKKCGHTPFKRVIPVEDMVAKIRVAIEARTRPETVIIARSDARGPEGFDAMLRRCQAYAEAGADVIFPEAMHSDAEMQAACAAIDKPVMANMADGGKTPIRPSLQLKDLGFAFAIFPAMTSLAAAAAVEAALRHLDAAGTSQGGPFEMFDFERFCRLIGFEEVWAFERRWAGESQ